MENLFLLGQVVLGVYFVLAGIKHFMKLEAMSGYAASKGIPMPQVLVILSGIILLLGGLGILFQYQLLWSYGALSALMAVFAVTMHAFWKTKDAQAAMGDRINFEKNLAIAAALLMLMTISA